MHAGLLGHSEYYCSGDQEMMSTIRKQLAEEDRIAIRNHEDIMCHTDVSPSQFLCQGLDLEDQQYVLNHHSPSINLS